MLNFEEQFKEFRNAAYSESIEAGSDTLCTAAKETIGQVWAATNSFLGRQALVTGAGTESLQDTTKAFGKATDVTNTEFTIGQLGGRAGIESLVRDEFHVPEDQVESATDTVAAILLRAQMGYDMDSHFSENRASDFTAGQENIDFVTQSTAHLYGGPTADAIHADGLMAVEAFGKDASNMSSDIRINIVVAMMKFHLNIVDRVMYRKPCGSNVVKYELNYNEVYDLEKASSNDAQVRNHSAHRIPVLDLYKNPDPVNTEAKRIKLLLANADGAELLADDKVVPGEEINLLQLSLDPNVINANALDYTDLVGDSVKIESVQIEVTDVSTGSDVVAIYEIPLASRHGAGFLMPQQNTDAGDRAMNLAAKLQFHSESVAASGDTQALKNLTGVNFVVADLRINGTTNLRNGDMFVDGKILPKLETKSGEEPTAEAKTAFGHLTFKFKAYTPEARHSEENMRRTTAAVQMLRRAFVFEIPQSRNYLVDYSLQQQKPAEVLATVSQILKIGNDARALTMIKAAIDVAHQRVSGEANGFIFEDHKDRTAFDYVAGTQVMPGVVKETLDMSKFTTIKSSDELSDVRAYMERKLLLIFAKLHSDTMYTNALGRGEKPCYKVITSGPILSTCFNVPHLHNHMDNNPKADGEQVEYKYVLSDGTQLDLVTTTFNSMGDQMLILPYRRSHPESELNWGNNCDRGQFTVQYTPTNGGVARRRVVVNSRECVYNTNAVAVVCTVTAIDEILAGVGQLGEVAP